MVAIRRIAAAMCCALLLFHGPLQAAPRAKKEQAEKSKTYGNTDIDQLRSQLEGGSEPGPSAKLQASPHEPAPANVYSNTDLSKLPDPTQLPPLPAGESTEPSQPAQIYTNQDLAPSAPTAEQIATPPDEATSEASIEAAARELDEAQARVDELEARLRAVRNPFLPRPALSPEEQQAWDGLDNAARRSRVEAQLEGAKEELSRAIDKLSKLKPGAPR